MTFPSHLRIAGVIMSKQLYFVIDLQQAFNAATAISRMKALGLGGAATGGKPDNNNSTN